MARYSIDLRINAVIFVIIIAILLMIVLMILINRYFDGFDGTGENGIISEKMDRTKLYGSLFLDGLDKVIKNMTDPTIGYDVKRIEVLRYSDVLL